jgi:hypothetical protein
MTEEQLQELASAEGSLTDVARAALRFELSRRGLGSEQGSAAAAPDEMEFRKLVTIRQFRDLPEALLAKSLLESAGIECFLHDECTVRMDWLLSNLLGGIKLRVQAEDADTAAGLLERGIPDGFDVQGVGEYEQPHCPHCRSVDISVTELNKPVAAISMFAGAPIALGRHNWKCQSCGREWQESEKAAP